MIREKEADLPKQPVQNHGPCCPTWAAFPQLTHSMLEPRSGRTVRQYKCDKCGERVWND